MAFVQPEFPFLADIWDNVNGLPATVRLDAPCNVAIGRRVTTLTISDALNEDGVYAQLLFPAGTDVRDRHSSSPPDFVEAPKNSGRFYLVVWVNDLGAGFANEHRVACCVKAGVWPTPLPAVFF
jgi:hypothetical protein